MSQPAAWTTSKPTAVIVLADGTVIEGTGCGKTGAAPAEICFNTAITGYQEILTDPSYAGQIVAFTFPHIGNVGANNDDIETLNAAGNAVRGCVLRAEITAPANWRAAESFDAWLKARTPMGRWGEVEELVGAAVFLASDAASFVTGQIIYVDGGVVSTI